MIIAIEACYIDVIKDASRSVIDHSRVRHQIVASLMIVMCLWYRPRDKIIMISIKINSLGYKKFNVKLHEN